MEDETNESFVMMGEESGNPSQQLSNSYYGGKYPGALRKSPFFQNLRGQLSEQQKLLESRLDAQIQTTSELQDFFKRRSEVESEFGKMLEKMHKSMQLKKRESTSMLNPVLAHLINDTRKEAKERLIISEICDKIVSRLSVIQEDLQRVFRQCQSVTTSSQEELLKVLHELYTSSKLFQTLQSEFKTVDQKLKTLESQKQKLEQSLTREKLEKSKKLKLLEKDVQKKLVKTNEAKYKAMKAKNEYILCMDAVNAAVLKYFVEDISDVIDCMDLGHYESITTALKLFLSTEEVKRDSITHNIENFKKLINSLDSRVDKQKFLESNMAFVMPKKVDHFENIIEDSKLETSSYLHEELTQRMHQLEKRLESLKFESSELWKTLETAENSLLNLIASTDLSHKVPDWFVGDSSAEIASASFSVKQRSDRVETDQFHINKYHSYMLGTNRIARLQAKYDHIRESLGIQGQPSRISTPSSDKHMRKRIGKKMSNNGAKLFGGSIEEYLEVYKIDIPCVITSCVRVVNLFGLHHQGIFRVSGSQLEINNFREAFERGEDPLQDMNADSSDINSVASLLKLYLRELREPLFPVVFFDVFMECAELPPEKFVPRMRELVTKSLPRSIFIVLRYLFHFLNHLSEYSDENMMAPYNLAICFGPTLVPMPEDKDQVQYQNLVNELIKELIIHAYQVFLPGGGGQAYDKNGFKRIVNSDTEETATEDDDEEFGLPPKIIGEENNHHGSRADHIHLACEDEATVATAQYDFKARSPRELSFKKGQSLVLFSRVSADWWRGKSSEEKIVGLIPDKYVLIREEEKSTTNKGPRSRTVSETMMIKTEHNNEAHQRSFSLSEQPHSHISSNENDLPDEPSTPNKKQPDPQPVENQNHQETKEPPPSIPEEEKPSTSSVSQPTPTTTAIPTNLKDTPDLVMDLPPRPEPSPSTSTESLTTAEVFATNQCTLKKGNKPSILVKPVVMAKPKLPKLIDNNEEK